MFFISPHCEPSLPVYSIVQSAVPYPWCLLIYIIAFTLAAYFVLLAAMGVKTIISKCHPNKDKAMKETDDYAFIEDK